MDTWPGETENSTNCRICPLVCRTTSQHTHAHTHARTHACTRKGRCMLLPPAKHCDHGHRLLLLTCTFNNLFHSCGIRYRESLCPSDLQDTLSHLQRYTICDSCQFMLVSWASKCLRRICDLPISSMAVLVLLRCQNFCQKI